MEAISDLSTSFTSQKVTKSKDKKFKVDHRKKKRAFIQNILFSLCFMLGTSPYVALLNLESIINPTSGLYLLAFLHFGCMCAIITTPVMKKFLRDKEIVLFGMGVSGVFLATHFYPKTYLLFTSATLFGAFGIFSKTLNICVLYFVLGCIMS